MSILAGISMGLAVFSLACFAIAGNFPLVFTVMDIAVLAFWSLVILADL